MHVFVIGPKEQFADIWQGSSYIGSCFVHAASEEDARKFAANCFDIYQDELRAMEEDYENPWLSDEAAFCRVIADLEPSEFCEGQIEVSDNPGVDISTWGPTPDGIHYKAFRNRRVIHVGKPPPTDRPMGVGVSGSVGSGEAVAGPAQLEGKGSVHDAEMTNDVELDMRFDVQVTRAGQGSESARGFGRPTVTIEQRLDPNAIRADAVAQERDNSKEALNSLLDEINALRGYDEDDPKKGNLTKVDLSKMDLDMMRETVQTGLDACDAPYYPDETKDIVRSTNKLLGRFKSVVDKMAETAESLARLAKALEAATSRLLAFLKVLDWM